MPDIEIHGNTVHYEEHGAAGDPLLLLVHGLYGDATMMRPLAEAFAARFRVIVPDALGHGRSARPTSFTLEDQGRMVDGLIAALGYERAALLGVSMGSYIGAQAAILDPARISGLVLVVSKAHGATSSSAAYAAREGFDLTTATPEQMMAFMSGALWSPATPQARRDELLAAQQAAQPVVLTAGERAAVDASLRDFDLRPRLDAITAPTLVLSGRSDGLNPPADGEEVARGIPGARFEVYEHAGHMLPFEQTDRLVAEVEAFLLRLG